MKLTGNLKKQVEKAETKNEKKSLIENAGMLLNDEELEVVSGGRGYNRRDYERAGVIIVGDCYFAKLSNGEKISISEIVANSMVDCYRLNGLKLTDEQLRAFIEMCSR
ncbi:MAG: hypothetical protein K5770_20260 [Lachnospiraceae bacterium]|nr:hypothetical protein [Lachnospiraceae bacterium]